MQFQRFPYQPQSPVTRFFAVLAGIGILALTLFLGIIFFAAFAAIGVLAWVWFQIRRWWLGKGRKDGRSHDTEDGSLHAEYRVVRNESRDDSDRRR